MTYGNGRVTEGTPIIPAPQLLTVLDWMYAKIQPADHLMGEVFSTTSRALISAPTGLGKTNFCMQLALAMAEGSNFLHWQAKRDGPAKVLYVDSEMSRRLMKQRIADTVRRAGYDPNSVEVPETIEFFCFDEVHPRPPPLNTAAGQQYFDNLIEYSGYEFIFFDNIQGLLAGNMAEEEPWKEILPWTFSLTQCGIGQIWVHHTGHDKSRGYGTSTRAWQMDADILLEEIERPGTDIAFKLKFLKARERMPDNRADFETMIITLERGRWLWEPIKEGKPQAPSALHPKLKPPSPKAAKFYDALNDALCTAAAERRTQSAGHPSVTQDVWIGELVRLGLLDPIPNDVGKEERIRANASHRALVSKYRSELIAAEWIACNAGYVWSTRT